MEREKEGEMKGWHRVVWKERRREGETDGGEQGERGGMPGRRRERATRWWREGGMERGKVVWREGRGERGKGR